MIEVSRASAVVVLMHRPRAALHKEQVVFTSHALSRCLPFAVLAIAATGLAAAPAVAQEMTVIKVPCQGGYPLWLWVEGADGACRDLGDGVMACEDASGNDLAQGSCSSGCDEVRVGSLAGCFRGDGMPNIYEPNFTLLCFDKKIDLKGVQGDTCKVTERNQAGDPVEAKCSQTQDGQEIVSAHATCKDGCVVSRPPGDCTVR